MTNINIFANNPINLLIEHLLHIGAQQLHRASGRLGIGLRVMRSAVQAILERTMDTFGHLRIRDVTPLRIWNTIYMVCGAISAYTQAFE